MSKGQYRSEDHQTKLRRITTIKILLKYSRKCWSKINDFDDNLSDNEYEERY